MPEERQKRKGGDAERRASGPRPLAAPLGEVSKRALGRRGFAEAGLVTDWGAIVGPELAAVCQPERLTFPPGKREGGTLRILVSGGVATELQHMEPLVLERINGHFGYRAVARLVLVHGTATTRERKSRRRAAARSAGPPDPEARKRIDRGVSSVDDPEIRAALMRLGRAILDQRRDGGEG